MYSHWRICVINNYFSCTGVYLGIYLYICIVKKKYNLIQRYQLTQIKKHNKSKMRSIKQFIIRYRYIHWVWCSHGAEWNQRIAVTNISLAM